MHKLAVSIGLQENLLTKITLHYKLFPVGSKDRGDGLCRGARFFRFLAVRVGGTGKHGAAKSVLAKSLGLIAGIKVQLQSARYSIISAENSQPYREIAGTESLDSFQTFASTCLPYAPRKITSGG